ncbi:MAG TPA: DUF4384 domain-containing protein [Gemmatimonadales bacterium]|nr:DUF4384 domain-containing protein [Gemmatimonadales bacterium]
MLTLLALLTTLGSGTQPTLPAVTPTGAPIRLWMNNDRRFRPGDRVRLQVDADVDGYLLVLNYDTDGRVRVLFPIDPRDDARVHAGRRYEVRQGDRDEAFQASGDGTGLIFTAVAQDPWRFDEVVLADRWDYSRLQIDRESTNPESDLSNLVQSIAGPGGFDYDVLGYRVYGESAYSYGSTVYPGRPIYVYDDYLYCNNWAWRYNGCNRWPYDGGWSFGFSYSPYRYGYGFGYGYPYGYGGYFPYGGHYPYRPGGYNRGPVIVGRPRGYAVVPRSPAVSVGGFAGSLPSGRNSSPVRVPDIDWRSRARPVGGSTARAPDRISRSGDRGSDFAPPARRARPENVDYPRARGGDNGSNDRGRRGGGDYAPRGGDGGGRSAPPPRSEPSRRDPPPQRSEPARSSGGNERGGGGHSSRPRRP